MAVKATTTAEDDDQQAGDHAMSGKYFFTDITGNTSEVFTVSQSDSQRKMVVLDDKSDLEWIRLVKDTRLEENARLASLSSHTCNVRTTCGAPSGMLHVDQLTHQISPVGLMNYPFLQLPTNYPVHTQYLANVFELRCLVLEESTTTQIKESQNHRHQLPQVPGHAVGRGYRQCRRLENSSQLALQLSGITWCDPEILT